MANLDLTGFYTKEHDYSGLDQATQMATQRQYRSDQMQQREESRKLGVSNFLSGYLDKKDFLTGTNYDPEIVRQLQETLNEGAELAAKGADTPTIMIALGPKVSRLNEYSTKAKLLDQRIKKQMDLIPQNSGYDKRRLEEEARKLAFYDKDQLKDITAVDPNLDYVTETVKLFPERVTTDSGIDEYIKNAPKYTNTKDITSYSPTGGMQKKKVKITSPSYLMPDVDDMGAVTGLVPQYQTALNDGQPLMHEFENEKGEKTKAAVRLLDEKLFDSIMSGNPGIADWVRGQVNSQLKDYKGADGTTIDINSPQAKNVARAIMYDEFKRRGGGSIEDVEVQNKPSTYEIKNYLGIPYYRPSSNGAATVNTATEGNEFDRIEENISLKKQGGKLVNNNGEANFSWSIPKSKIPASMNAILKAGGYDLSNVDVFHLNIKDGKIESITLPGEVTNVDKGESVGGQTITRQDMENAQLKYNTEPAKGEQLKFGKKTKATTPPAPEDDGFTKAELKSAGWTDKQISEAQKAGKIKIK